MTKQKPNEVDKSLTIKNGRINLFQKVFRGEDEKGKQYVEIIKKDKSADQPELTWAREKICRLRIALLEFGLYDRCYVILHREITGFSHNELVDLYGIHKDLISRLAGQYKQPKTVRQEAAKRPKRVKVVDMLARPYVFNDQFLAFVATLARIPYSWVNYEKPPLEWEDRHFANFGEDFYIEEKKFEETVAQVLNNKKAHHYMYPMIVTCDDGLELYLRIEVLNGAFMVELFNKDYQTAASVKLMNLFSGYQWQAGYMETVVIHHYDFCLKEISWPDTQVPPEFKPLDF